MSKLTEIERDQLAEDTVSLQSAIIGVVTDYYNLAIDVERSDQHAHNVLTVALSGVIARFSLALRDRRERKPWRRQIYRSSNIIAKKGGL